MHEPLDPSTLVLRRVPRLDDTRLSAMAHAAARGDRAARNALWEIVGGPLVGIARRTAVTFPATDAEDAAQDAFVLFAVLVAAWAKEAGAGVEHAPFGPYLFGRFRLHLMNMFRAYERQLRPPPHAARTPDDFTASAARALWQEHDAELRAFAETLPPRERDIFLLRIRDGLNLGEAAHRLGVTRRSVSRYWNLTLKRLRE